MQCCAGAVPVVVNVEEAERARRQLAKVPLFATTCPSRCIPVSKDVLRQGHSPDGSTERPQPYSVSDNFMIIEII